MLNKKTKIILTICLILTVFVFSNNVLAASSKYIFEVKIPWVNTDAINGFGDLVNQIIALSYRIAILFALYKIIEIGFKYMTGTGKAESIAAVAKGAKNLLVGMLILFGSYIILYTINPDLTKLPNNINCPDGSRVCDTKTYGDVTEVEILCDPKAVGYDESEKDVNLKPIYTTYMAGTTESDIVFWVDRNRNSIDQTNDWYVALNDLRSGKVSNNIWEAIKLAIEDKDEWLDVTSCSTKIEPGPIKTSHEKAGNYISCHDTYEAVDFVVRDKEGNIYSDKARDCMKALMSYIRMNMAGKVTVCDEIDCEPPHIHVQDIECKVPCRSCN